MKRFHLPDIKHSLHGVGPLIALTVFSAAIILLHKNLAQYHFQDIVASLKEIHRSRIFMAIGFTGLSYTILSCYDALALKYIGKRLPPLNVALTSFISYAFANNTGSLSIIASSSLRYRLYGAWGLSAIDIGRVIVFCMSTFWLGFLSLGGMTLLFALHSVLSVIHLQVFQVKLLGGLFIAVVTGYLIFCAMRKKSIKVMGWEISLPPFKLALGQIGIAAADLGFAAGTLYSLLPRGHGLSYPAFLGIFLAAIIAGLLSNVPGGLGVFESIMLVLLSPFIDNSAVIGSLLAFRAIYYLLPLMAAFFLLAGLELFRQKKKIGQYASSINQTASVLVPHIFAFGAFTGGTILMFSGATPSIPQRLEILKDIVALPVLELSHFLGSLVGMGLLVLGSGLRKRLDAAYILTAILLVTGVILSILKGFDYEEAAWLFGLLLALLPNRKQFYRKASIFSEPLSASWIGAIFIVVLGSVWLGLFSYKHVEYSDTLWWHFAFTDDAPRFLRAATGLVCGALFFAAYNLFQPAPPSPEFPDDDDLQKALEIATLSPHTSAYLALLGDKKLLFSEGKEAFLMYAVQGRSWVVMGDPVGKAEEIPQLLWDFKSLCNRYSGRPVFYEVRPTNLHFYLDIGMTPLKIGEEGRVLLETFSLEGPARKTLRYSYNHALRDSCLFEVIYPEKATAILPTLQAVSNAWLADKKVQEKGFSLGYFDEKYLKYLPIAIVRREGEIIAFANLLTSGVREELSIDLMRYLPQSPHGVMDYLFLEIMLWGKKNGFRWFNLGMAPFAGFENRSLSPLWQRLGAFVFHHGEHFYNFQGLRFYKDKFAPTWEPKYLAVPGGFALPKILADVASLISGGIRGIFFK